MKKFNVVFLLLILVLQALSSILYTFSSLFAYLKIEKIIDYSLFLVFIPPIVLLILWLLNLKFYKNKVVQAFTVILSAFWGFGGALSLGPIVAFFIGILYILINKNQTPTNLATQGNSFVSTPNPHPVEAIDTQQTTLPEEKDIDQPIQ